MLNNIDYERVRRMFMLRGLIICLCILVSWCVCIVMHAYGFVCVVMCCYVSAMYLYVYAMHA